MPSTDFWCSSEPSQGELQERTSACECICVVGRPVTLCAENDVASERNRTSDINIGPVPRSRVCRLWLVDQRWDIIVSKELLELM